PQSNPEAEALINRLQLLLTERTVQQAEIDKRLATLLGSLSVTEKKEPTFIDRIFGRSLGVIAVFALPILVAPLLYIFVTEERARVAEERARVTQSLTEERARVAQSLTVINNGQAPDLQQARDQIFEFIHTKGYSLRKIELNESFFSFLLSQP